MQELELQAVNLQHLNKLSKLARSRTALILYNPMLQHRKGDECVKGRGGDGRGEVMQDPSLSGMMFKLF